MEKDVFNSMILDKQLEYINERLSNGESMQTINKEMNLNKNTIPTNFKRKGYVYRNKQYIRNNDVSNDVNVSSVKDVSKKVSSIIPSDVSKNIIINKTVDSIKPRRVSFYLDVSTIKKINQLAKDSNKGISEFVQKLLNETLDNIKIE